MKTQKYLQSLSQMDYHIIKLIEVEINIKKVPKQLLKKPS